MLAELRVEAGLRQVDLANKLGVYQSWVTHMESGQRRIDVVEATPSETGTVFAHALPVISIPGIVADQPGQTSEQSAAVVIGA